MNFAYNFEAVKGYQAKREYYIAMVPMGLLARLFDLDEEYVLPEYRAQRRINEIRIPEIKEYIIKNRSNYVFSALSASIDGKFEFEPMKEGAVLGVLSISMDAKLLLNDGQHRKAAIKAAIADDYSLSDETISVVFFKDEGLRRSQQMFTDLNKHAVKTSNSLSTLYDMRDGLAVATKTVINSVDFFNKYTDKERDILGSNSPKLFTLSNIYKANLKIVRTTECTKQDIDFMIEYWTLVTTNIEECQELIRKEISRKTLRENYIIVLGVTMSAIGRLGHFFYENKNYDMNDFLIRLQCIDWSRECKENWENRIIRPDGRVKNSDEASILGCSKIKQLIGVELSKEEEAREKNFNWMGE